MEGFAQPEKNTFYQFFISVPPPSPSCIVGASNLNSFPHDSVTRFGLHKLQMPADRASIVVNSD